MPNLQESLQVLNFFRAVGAVKERKEEARKTAAFQEHKYAAEQYRKKREFVLTKWIDYIKGLKEGPSKDLARAQFKDHIGSWEPWEREAFAPYLQKVSTPAEEKLREFQKLRGDPVDPGVISPTEDPVSRAKLEFANIDYIDERDEYVLGIKRPRKNTAYIGEDQWAWRDEENRMGVLSREGATGQEWIQKTLDNAKMTWDMAMVQGGEVPQGSSKTIIDGKTKYELTPTMNVLNGRQGFKKVAVGRVLQEGQRELPQILSDFSTSFTLGQGVGIWENLKGGAPEGAALYDHLQSRLDALEWIPLEKGEVKPSKLDPESTALQLKGMIREELGTHMAGWNVEVYNAGKFKRGLGFIDKFAQSDNSVIYFIPGVPTPFENEKGEFVGALYWDEDYNVVRDSFNQVKGTRAEVEAEAFGLKKNAWTGEEE